MLITLTLLVSVMVVRVRTDERIMLPTGAVVTLLLVTLVLTLGKRVSVRNTELIILEIMVALVKLTSSIVNAMASMTLGVSKKFLDMLREAVAVASISNLMSS